jgi:hypothetical protein
MFLNLDVNDFYFKSGYSNQGKKYDVSLSPNNVIITASFGIGEPDPKIYHQIPDQLFDLLLV